MALPTPLRPLVTWAASLALTVPVFGLAISPSVGRAEVPGAPRLLPEQTYIYARVENANELRKDMADSPIGKMMADPKLRPFAGDIYSTAAELFQQVGGQLGLTLDELLAIPQGQVAFGLVGTSRSTEAAPVDGPNADGPKDESPDAIRRRLAQRQREQGGIGAMLLIETGDRNEALFNLLDELEEQVARSGAVGRTETIGSTTIRRLVDPGSGESRVEYFHRDGATVIGFGNNVATDTLARWDGKSSGKTLAESTDFAAVMGRCIGAADTRPQMTFFADPYRLARRAVAQGGLSAGLVWQIFEELGVSKVRGLGASTFHGGETFADIAHAHILVDPPRDGIFSVLRPKAGDTNPPAWVPEDITSYLSVGWRADATYDGLGRILDRFQGDGALGRLVEEPYKTRVGGDFRTSIIDALDDRVVMIQWLQPPVRINSAVSINAVKLKDATAATQTVDELVSRFPAQIRKDSIGAVTLYLFGDADRLAQLPEGLRRPTPCAMILGDWLLTSDSREFMERAIRARDGALPRLSELPEYDLVASELGGQLGADKPFMLSFSRSSQVLRQFYELAKSDQTRSFLQTRGEANPVARGVADLMKRNQLPPFEEFEKYFAPSGGFAYDEPSGIHFGRYTLKASE